MSALILPFEPLRPYVVLHSPGVMHSGRRLYLVDCYPTEVDGGGSFGMFDSEDYATAREAAREMESDGCRVIDTTGGMA